MFEWVCEFECEWVYESVCVSAEWVWLSGNERVSE